MPDNTARDIAVDIAQLLVMQQAEDVTVLDLTGLTPVTDFFVISTGKNLRHLKALARQTSAQIAKYEIETSGEEGSPESGWILVDAGDVVVHIFDARRRALYKLEMLWGDAAVIAPDQDSSSRQ